MIDLDEAKERGELQEVRIIGALNFEDKKEERNFERTFSPCGFGLLLA